MKGQLASLDLGEAARLVGLRPNTVSSTAGADLAYLRFLSENRLVQELAQDLPEAQARSIINRQFDDLVAELSATERQIYNQADSFFSTNPNGGKGFARGGNDAIGNDEFADLVGACPSNSFSGDTLVEMADGSLLPIADVQVGDQVLAYDFDIGETVGREVTATLPHTDWLLEAHFSDGSTLTVTEDHRFWSVTDTEWVELQHLDTDDILLTPDGVTVTVDYLDWNVGADAPAWDLTVAEEHNFFVAVDDTAEPVLVHNNTPGLFCGVTVDADLAQGLVGLNRRLDDAGDAGSVGAAMNKLAADLADDGLDVAGVERILNVILDVERRGDLGLAETMARNLAADPRATEGIVRRELQLAASDSANAGVYSEQVLGDVDYPAVWTMSSGRQDQVLVRIDDPDFWSFESDATNAAELRIRDYLVEDDRSVDNFPLEPIPGRPDPDALVDGVKTDFKSLSEFGGENALYNNVRGSLQSPQGPNLVVDTRLANGSVVDDGFARVEVERALNDATGVQLSRIDVILNDGALLVWIQGQGFLP